MAWGSSNTPLTDKFVVNEAGIDTATAAFRIERRWSGKMVKKLSDGRTARFFPSHSMVQVQGHPSGSEDLAADDAMFQFVEAAAADFSLGHFLGFARVDSTATIAFDDGRDGAALLQAAASLRLPYVKPSTFGNPLETVYLRSRRSPRVLGRVYDKGVESKSADPGTLIRFEDQRRWSGQSRPMGVVGLELFRSRFDVM